MRWETIRDRVQQKIDETDANMASLSRELGHSDGFMHAFLVTKKQKSLKMQDIEKLSKIFKVTEDWLLGSDDGDGRVRLVSVSGVLEKSMLEKTGIDFGDVVSVGEMEKRRIMLAGLDILNWSCSIVDGGGPASQIVKGYIVDPALFKTSNAYLSSFASRSQITVSLKKVKLSNQEEVWFILNLDKA